MDADEKSTMASVLKLNSGKVNFWWSGIWYMIQSPLKSSKKLNAIFTFWLITWVILGQFWYNKMYFVQKNLRSSMKATRFKFRGFFCWFRLCFGKAAFDTDTRRKSILSSIRWCDYFVGRVTDKFRVMINLLINGSACPVFAKHFDSVV